MTAPSTPSPQPTATGAPRAGGAGPLGDRTVSRIGYGAIQLERLHADRDAAIALLRRAVELGVDHVDTAQFYGNGFVNELIRDAFRSEDGIVVAGALMRREGQRSNSGHRSRR